MPRPKPSFRLFAVLFPLLALLVWTISVQFNHSRGESVRLKIVGYDPVDFFSGHYLRFRYDLGRNDLCHNTPNKTVICACLEANGQGTLEATRFGSCDEIQDQCATLIKGNCQHLNFLTSSERFYFPEEYSSVLAVVPPDSQAEVRISKDGSITLHKIFVKDQEIFEYAKERIQKAATP